MMNEISILLADDHKLVRQGLKKLLELNSGFKVVGEADNGRAVMLLSQQLCPSIILMDITMPILNGIEASRQILRHLPSTRILMLSAHRNDAYTEDLIALGVAGYVHKNDSFSVLAQAIRQIVRGGTYFGASTRPARSFNDTNCVYGKHLSSREMEVLQLIAEGEANKQIADDLQISIKTVEKHRQNVMNKLRIHDTAGLTRFAISAGVIECPMDPTLLAIPRREPMYTSQLASKF